MTSKWKPAQYIDEYQASVHKWIEETVHHMPHAKTKNKPTTSMKAVDFIDLLKQSLKSGAKKKAKKSSITAMRSSTLTKTKSKYTRHATKH